jgi:hypothetical protein
LGELLRIGSRSSQLRVPTVLKQDSQGFPNGSVHYSGKNVGDLLDLAQTKMAAK